MFNLIHDVRKCPNNNVSLREARGVLNVHTGKTACRVLDIIYSEKGHEYVNPRSKAGGFLYGKPIHKLNTRLIMMSNAGIDISKIRIKDIPESDAFWLQEGETIIDEDNFFMNNMYAFRLLKGGTSKTSTSSFQGNMQKA